jgi:hypothetical protein
MPHSIHYCFEGFDLNGEEVDLGIEFTYSISRAGDVENLTSRVVGFLYTSEVDEEDEYEVEGLEEVESAFSAYLEANEGFREGIKRLCLEEESARIKDLAKEDPVNLDSPW